MTDTRSKFRPEPIPAAIPASEGRRDGQLAAHHRRGVRVPHNDFSRGSVFEQAVRQRVALGDELSRFKVAQGFRPLRLQSE
jgi:hypothetical protein